MACMVPLNIPFGEGPEPAENPKFGNVLVFAQLIHRPMGAKIQLSTNPNIAKLGIFYRL